MTPGDLTASPSTDPIELYRLRDGFYATDLLGAALVYLDLFSWLEQHPSDLAGICREHQLVARPADVMMTLFTALGLVENRAGQFHLTALAQEHLATSSPWFLGPYYAALKNRPVCKDYVNVLHTGRPANWGSFQDNKDWAKAMEDDAFAAQFTAAMDCRGSYLGPAVARVLDLSEHGHLLDVAGGSGVYACAIVARHPHLRATVLEKSLGVCRRIFEANVRDIASGAYRTIDVDKAGSAFGYKDVARICVDARPAHLARASDFGDYAAFFPQLTTAIASVNR